MFPAFPDPKIKAKVVGMMMERMYEYGKTAGCGTDENGRERESEEGG